MVNPSKNSLQRSLALPGNFKKFTTIPIQHRILRHLIPDEIGSRWVQLYTDPDTCHWVLEPV